MEKNKISSSLSIFIHPRVVRFYCCYFSFPITFDKCFMKNEFSSLWQSNVPPFEWIYTHRYIRPYIFKENTFRIYRSTLDVLRALIHFISYLCTMFFMILYCPVFQFQHFIMVSCCIHRGFIAARWIYFITKSPFTRWSILLATFNVGFMQFRAFERAK